MKTIAKILGDNPLEKIQITPVADQPPPPQRARTFTPLDALRFDHLNPAQRVILKKAVDGAREFARALPSQPGLSLILGGPVGVGKTTIAENILQCFTADKIATDPLLAERVDSLTASKRWLDDPQVLARMGVSTRAQGEAMIDAQIAAARQPIKAVRSLEGRLFDATDIMNLLGDSDVNLGRSFAGQRCIVIDDAGEETISFTSGDAKSSNYFDLVRAKRYGRLLDFAQRRGISVIITTNAQLTKDGKVSGKFTEIFGQRGWSRLTQMAGGFMYDLSGLPDYRELMVTRGRR